MTNPSQQNPFQPNPFGGSEPFATQQPPPTPPRDEANVLATLSLVFAFVFAPAGAILGHLGLRQIRRTGGRGRDRALVGVTLSYVFITAAVVALVISAILTNTSQTRVAAPPTTTTTARTTTTTTTTTPPPPPPTLAPADLDGLLPTLDDVRNFTGDSGLTLHVTYHQLTNDPNAPSLDRPECLAVMEDSAPEAYDVPAIAGYSESDFTDTRDRHHLWTVGEGVSAFHDGTAAQAQLAKLQSIWRECGGSTAHQTYPNRGTYSTTMKPPADAGNGITTMETVTAFDVTSYGVRAIAAKANVVIDVGAWSTNSIDRRGEVALDITNYILNKIPG